jgi:hypothetical protein
MKFINKNKVVMILALCLAAVCGCSADADTTQKISKETPKKVTEELSETLKTDKGFVYQIFEVPITKKLANSFKNCSDYKVNYKADLASSAWTNQIGREDTLQIQSAPQDICIVTHKVSAYNNQPEETVRMAVPRGLTQKLGELLLASFNPTPQTEEEIKNFAACMSVADSDPAWRDLWQKAFLDQWQGGLFSPDPNNYYNKFIRIAVEEYLPKWDQEALKQTKQKPYKCW